MEPVLRPFFDPPLNIREKIILPVALTGLIISIYLVSGDIEVRGYCSTLGVTPTCYLTADAYIFILLSIFFVKKNLENLFFFSGIVLGASISIYFSISHLLFLNHCAIFFGFPDCFLNIFLFAAIFITKTLKISISR
jgi:hypothetical protein